MAASAAENDDISELEEENNREYETSAKNQVSSSALRLCIWSIN